MELPVISKIKELVASVPVDEDGEELGTKMLSGFSLTEIEEVESEIGITFCPEVRELLLYCKGLQEFPMEYVDFIGAAANYYYLLDEKDFIYREVSADGFGNSWFFIQDLCSDKIGPIFYYMHEGPYILYQSENIFDFIDECIKFCKEPYDSLIDDIHELRLKPIKDLTDDLISKSEALKGDKVLSQFANKFTDNTVFFDFRKAKVGDGLDLVKFDAVDRCESEPIFALTEKQSIVKKIINLFGRLS